MKHHLSPYRLVSYVVAAVIGLTALPSQAAEATPSDAESQNILKLLKEKYPDKPLPDYVGPSPIPGLYELLSGSQLLYVDATATHFIFNAALMDMPRKLNLTEKRLGELLIINPSDLDIKDALVTVKGNGSRKLYVFSDPHCPYCQKLEPELEKLTDVTVYTFIVPRPDAKVAAVSIWCSADRAQAWSDYMKTRLPLVSKSCDNPIERNLAVAQKFAINGTPTLIFASGKRIPGLIPSDQLLAELVTAQTMSASSQVK